jgi:hypothetical protein
MPVILKEKSKAMRAVDGERIKNKCRKGKTRQQCRHGKKKQQKLPVLTARPGK